MNKLTTFILIFLGTQSNAQLKINAGGKIYLCESKVLAPINASRGYSELGGMPTATGGTPPYRYHWEIINKSFPNMSIFDSTNANPTASIIGNNPTIYKLTVKDSIGTTLTDTAYVFFSVWKCIAGELYITKKKYDTVNIQAGGCSSNFSHVKCSWSPNSYLTDTNNCNSRTYTPTNLIYHYKIIDSIGCVGGYSTTVSVDESSIQEPIGLSTLFLQFTNPIDNQSVYLIQNKYKDYVLEVYNIEGSLIIAQNLGLELKIGSLISIKGLYFCQIFHPLTREKIMDFKLLKN